MRQAHRPGEKLFLDYSGKKPRICDPETGEVTELELFVGVLGVSNYTLAEATHSQTVPVHEHMRGASYYDTDNDNDTRRNDSEAHQLETARAGQPGVRPKARPPSGPADAAASNSTAAPVTIPRNTIA